MTARRRTLVLVGSAAALVAFSVIAARWKEAADTDRAGLVSWAATLEAEGRHTWPDPDHEIPELTAPSSVPPRWPTLMLLHDGMFLNGARVDDLRQRLEENRATIEQSREVFGVGDPLSVVLVPGRNATWKDIAQGWNVSRAVGAESEGIGFAVTSRALPPGPSRVDDRIQKLWAAPPETFRQELDALHDELLGLRCPAPFFDRLRGIYPMYPFQSDAERIGECLPIADFASIKAVLWAQTGRRDGFAVLGMSAAAIPAASFTTGKTRVIEYPGDTRWERIATEVVMALRNADAPVCINATP